MVIEYGCKRCCKVIKQRELIQIQIEKYNHLYNEAKRQSLPSPFMNNLKALIDIEVNHLELLLKKEGSPWSHGSLRGLPYRDFASERS